MTVAAENMNTEAIFMLEKYAGITDADTRMNITRKQSIRPNEAKKMTASYQEHYVNVSSKNINLLKSIYKYDIILFDYPDTPYVDFSKS